MSRVPLFGRLSSLLYSLDGLCKTQNSASCIAQRHIIDLYSISMKVEFLYYTFQKIIYSNFIITIYYFKLIVEQVCAYTTSNKLFLYMMKKFNVRKKGNSNFLNSIFFYFQNNTGIISENGKCLKYIK